MKTTEFCTCAEIPKDNSPVPPESIDLVGSEALKLAILATEKLFRALDETDTKTAKDLSSIIKDMVALHREICGEGSREVRICFTDETGRCAE